MGRSRSIIPIHGAPVLLVIRFGISIGSKKIAPFSFRRLLGKNLLKKKEPINLNRG